MAVGRGSILRAAKAQSKTKKDSPNNVEFLTQVSEEVPEAMEEKREAVSDGKTHVCIKDPMPSHLL